MGSYNGYGGGATSGGKDGQSGSAGAFQSGGLGVVSGNVWGGTKGHFNSQGNLQGYSNGATDKGWNEGYGQADTSFGNMGLSGSDSVNYQGNPKGSNGNGNGNGKGGGGKAGQAKTGLNKNGKPRKGYYVAPPTVIGPWETVPEEVVPASYTPSPPQWADYVKFDPTYTTPPGNDFTGGWGQPYSNGPQYRSASQGGGRTNFGSNGAGWGGSGW